MAAAFTWTISTVAEADGLITCATQEMPTPDGVGPHAIVFALDAVGVRMTLYNLASSRDAVEAIFREFGAAQAGVAFDPADLTTVAIDYTGTASGDLDTILAAAADQIQAAAAALTAAAGGSS